MNGCRGGCLNVYMCMILWTDEDWMNGGGLFHHTSHSVCITPWQTYVLKVRTFDLFRTQFRDTQSRSFWQIVFRPEVSIRAKWGAFQHSEQQEYIPVKVSIENRLFRTLKLSQHRSVTYIERPSSSWYIDVYKQKLGPALAVVISCLNLCRAYSD